jgi:hypothetical protein
MILRHSRFTHVVALGGGRVLILHAVTQLRLAVDGEVERLLGCFDQPRSLPEDFPDLSRVVGYDVATLAGCVAALLERGFLSEKTADEEAAEIASQLLETAGRDPGEMLDRFRRERSEGAASYWAASATRSLVRRKLLSDPSATALRLGRGGNEDRTGEGSARARKPARER